MNKSIYFLKIFIIFFFTSLFYTAQADTSLTIFQPGNNQVYKLNTSQSSVYVALVYNHESDATVHWTYLKTHTSLGDFSEQGSNTIPDQFNLGPGSYHFELELWAYIPGSGDRKLRTADVYFTVEFDVRAKNSFNSGTINMDGATTTNDTAIPKYPGEVLSVGAIDQSSGGYNMVWNTSGVNNSIWRRRKLGEEPMNITGATSRNYSYTVQSDDNGTTLIADMKKSFVLSFNNQFSGSTAVGEMTINGTTSSAPASTNVVEQNSVTVGANYQYENLDTYFSYRFSQWSDGVTTQSRTISSPTAAQSYTAVYKKVPKFSLTISNLQVTSSSDNHVKLTWTDHPDAGVTGYQIWKRVRYKNDVMQDETPVEYAYVRRGVGYFVDPNLTFNEDNTEDKYWVSYCVVACYAPDQTTSPVTIWTSYFNAWTDDGPGTLPIDKQLSSNQTVIVNEYSLKNYPNPFNPTTQIEYSIKEDGFVTIRIYDITGKEITTLVNKPLSKGVYKAEFNASNMASGVYIYTIKVNNFFSAQKMILAR